MMSQEFYSGENTIFYSISLLAFYINIAVGAKIRMIYAPNVGQAASKVFFATETQKHKNPQNYTN